ncbi:unnamed protein product, partial [Choristocarpus tenellus]
MNIAISSVRKVISGAASTMDPLVQDVRKAKEIFGGLGTRGRALTTDEVEELEADGNWASDWSLIRVSPHVDRLARGRIRGSFFHGPVELGNFEDATVALPGAESSPLPSGIYSSTLAWCVIGDGALIK